MNAHTAAAALLCLFSVSACTVLPDIAPADNNKRTVVTSPDLLNSFSSTIAGTDLLSPLMCSGTTLYRPVPAFPSSNYQEIKIDGSGKVIAKPESWPNENEKKNKLLPNISTEISVQDDYVSAGLGSFASGNGKIKKITIDFMKYRSEPIKDNSGNIYMFSRVGAGLRIVIRLDKWDAEASSGGLLPIALSAKAGNLHGYITADIIGLNASDITLSMPFTSDVSDKSIQSIIEAMAVIRSKFHEDKTFIDPQFIARIDCVNIKSAP